MVFVHVTDIVIDCFVLVAIAVDCLVSKTVSQLFFFFLLVVWGHFKWMIHYEVTL